MDIVTTQSYATTNVPLTYKNLMLSGSVYSQSVIVGIEGGAGGPYNAYNTLETGSVLAQLDGPTNIFGLTAGVRFNILQRISTPQYPATVSTFLALDVASTLITFPPFPTEVGTTAGQFFTVEKSVRTPIYWNPKYNTAPGDTTLEVESDKRGIIFFKSSWLSPPPRKQMLPCRFFSERL